VAKYGALCATGDILQVIFDVWISIQGAGNVRDSRGCDGLQSCRFAYVHRPYCFDQ
jgi:hypothetical protein